MASTPSQNNAFELMNTGEKSGQWGDITNTNLEIIDRATKGVGAITLTGSGDEITTVDYTASDGHYAVLVFSGTAGTVTINPNDQQKVFIVKNTTAGTVTITQGSGGDVAVGSGSSAIIYANGAGSAAEVVDLTSTFNIVGAGSLLATNNLSDLDDDGIARTNLGVAVGTDVLAYDSNLQSFVDTFTLPVTDSTSGYAVTTDGAGALVFAEVATAAQGDLADSALQSGDNVSELVNDAGYLTSATVGAITGVTAGSGISGGGTSGTVTVSHADTSSQASVDNSGAVVIQDVTLDTYGHVTGLGTVTLTPAIIEAATSAQGDLADTAIQSGDSFTGDVIEATNFYETVGTIAAGTLDLSTGNVFFDAPSTSTTYVFDSPPTSGTAYGFTLRVAPSATITISWPASVNWPGGTPPDAPASGRVSVYVFYTQDGGTTYFGFVAGEDMS